MLKSSKTGERDGGKAPGKSFIFAARSFLHFVRTEGARKTRIYPERGQSVRRVIKTIRQSVCLCPANEIRFKL